jgi:hypothetical protein
MASHSGFRHYSWPYSWHHNATRYYDNNRPARWTRPHTGDAVVKSDIEERLFRHPFLNADHIEVSVSSGVATLTGTSDNSIEEAVNLALERTGKTIHNLSWFQIVETRGNIDNNKVKHWQVTVKIGFALD